MKQDFTFSSDETAHVSFRLAIDAALIAMANKDDRPLCDSDIVNKEGITGKVTTGNEGGDLICTVTMSGPMERVVEALSENKLNKSSGQTHEFSLTRDGDAYILALELPAMRATVDEDDNPMAKTIETMLLAKLSGRVLAWSVTAPQILESSGEISSDKTVARYTRPLAEAYMSKEPTRFTVKFALGSPSVSGWIKGLFSK